MTQSCPVAHNRSQADRKALERWQLGQQGAEVRWSGRVCETGWLATLDQKGGGERGEVTAWSAASRRRFLKFMASLDLKAAEGDGRFSFVTLTWRNDPGPEKAHRDLRALELRLRRYLPSVVATWKLEFQRRGVPHFHMLLLLPSRNESYLVAFRHWLWRSWDEVTGGYDLGDGVRRQNRVDVGWCYARDVARYITADYTKAAKGYQFRAPKEWRKTGRWWGKWGMAPNWQSRRISYNEFIAARRVLRRHRSANSMSKIRTGRSNLPTSIWVIGDEVGTLYEQVERYLARLST